MMANITNISEANQRIGALEHELETEKQARTAVQSDLEQANTAHTEEVESLRGSHAKEMDSLKANHAKEVTALNDKLDAVKSEVEQLKADAKSADERAAEIVAQSGGAPAAPDAEDDSAPEATQENIDALYEERSKLKSSAEKRAFYVEKIQPLQEQLRGK